MNIKDSELVALFVVRALNASSDDLPKVTADFLKRAEGTAGSGVCICGMPPDRDRTRNGVLVDDLNSRLDHRCPHHGEKAQPLLWGRHKTHELLVTPAQWDSLGVKS